MKALFKFLLPVCIVLLAGFDAGAQPVYRDASAFPLFGKAVEEGGPRYRRLPPGLEGEVREPVWRLGCNSSGLYIRFRSDAPSIHARWTNTGYHMPHMTDCGTGGLDLYVNVDGQWHFAGSGFNWGAISSDHERKLVGNMQPAMREYMLYLALYDEIRSLELGVPEGYVLEQPVLDSPKADAPVVMYGTSILHGCSASRPGMAFTNILARWLDRTTVNLGFSGNAKLDYPIAELMAKVEHPAVFVLDYVPNSSAELINEKGERFFRILRDRHPGVPVIFVEDPLFPHGIVDEKIAEEVRSKNEAQKALFRKLSDAGEALIWYVPAEGLVQEEDFVDGVHFTDTGMIHYSQRLFPVIQEALAAGL